MSDRSTAQRKNSHNTWRHFLPQLAGLPLLPIGPGGDGKAPADPKTGANLKDWQTAAFSPEEVAAACSKITAVGVRPGPAAGGLIAFDIDGATAVALLTKNGCDPFTAPTWQVRRDTDADRLKVIWRLPEELRDHLPCGVAKVATKRPSARGAGDGENVATYYGAGQVLVLGQHLSSGGNYFWSEGHGPADLAEITPDWWQMALRIAEKQPPTSKASSSSTGRGDWRRINPCPICGRDQHAICSKHRDGRSILCFHGSTFQPPELKPGQVITGSDGEQWAFTRIRNHGDIGEFSHFRIDEPASSSTADVDVEQVEAGFPDHGDNSQQQGQQRPKPFQVLGWCKAREKVWYRHRQTAQIASVKPIGQSELIKLADLSYWSSCYPRKDKDGNLIGINWPHAACALIADANKAGIFELEQVRGRGVWLDGEQVVWHLGDRLEVDGQETPLAALQSVQHYGLMPRLEIDLKAEPLDDDHGRKILDVLKDRGWQGPSDHLHLAGFCVLSNVCGALRKRPGLQITSAFGRGKSDTIDNAILPLQGGIGRISTGSTEAGIRQLIGRDALPATIDESEAEDGRKREAQLRLVRYSFDGIPVVKGTPSGDAMTFCLRSSLALSGINSPIDNPADRSRIAVISPRHLPKDQWNQLEKRRSTLITVEIGQRLMRRTVSNLPALLANITTFGHLISAMIPSTEGGRTGDTFGALLAGAHHLTSTRQINEIEALDWLDLMGWEIGHTNTDETDRSAGAEGRQCLEHLLSHELRWIIPYEPDAGRPSTGSLTVRELLDLAKNSPCSIDGQEARSELGRKGMHITEQGLAVARTSEGGKKIFEATKWANGGHSDRLLELEGATRAPSTIAFPKGGSHRAVLLPWAVVGPLGELDSTARGSAF